MYEEVFIFIISTQNDSFADPSYNFLPKVPKNIELRRKYVHLYEDTNKLYIHVSRF